MNQEIEFTIDGEKYEIGVTWAVGKAQTTKTLLLTGGLDDFRVRMWNQEVDVIESGIVVFVANGGNISDPAFIEMIKCQVTILKRRFSL
jgi:hypothetical protein